MGLQKPFKTSSLTRLSIYSWFSPLRWFILEGGLAPEVAQTAPIISRRLCAEIGPQALALCDAFDISDTMLSAPVALDWVSYNSYDNKGEVEDPPAL